MTLGILFWVLVLLWVLFGFYWNYSDDPRLGRVGPRGNMILLLALIVLLGWGVFGAPVH
ncbi:MAG: hypothetical protein ACYDC2_11700 [Solirubrobacteraceae bacterium]